MTPLSPCGIYCILSVTLMTSCKSSEIWGLAPTIFPSEMSPLLYSHPGGWSFSNLLSQQPLLSPPRPLIANVTCFQAFPSPS